MQTARRRTQQARSNLANAIEGPEPVMKLWSRRWSVARGESWVWERDCMPATANEWLEVFRKSEPTVMFVLSYSKPRQL